MNVDIKSDYEDMKDDYFDKMPLVSFCIPTYNNEEYIKETLDTVMNQTYLNIELIVVDDNSKDNTYNIIVKEYKDNYICPENKRRVIKLYKNEKNLGMSGNWNKSLSLCTGKYLKLLCADDLLDENATAYEVNIMEKYKDVLCVSSDTQFVDKNGVKKGFYRRYHKCGIIDGISAVKFSLFSRNFLGAPLANLFRKDIYDKIGGFDPSFSYIIDYDFYIRVYLQGKVYILHMPLNFFRIRDDSNTGEVLGGDKGKIYVKEHKKLVKKVAKIIGLNSLQVWFSVTMRKVMNVLGRIYLKVNLPKES